MCRAAVGVQQAPVHNTRDHDMISRQARQQHRGRLHSFPPPAFTALRSPSSVATQSASNKSHENYYLCCVAYGKARIPLKSPFSLSLAPAQLIKARATGQARSPFFGRTKARAALNQSTRDSWSFTQDPLTMEIHHKQGILRGSESRGKGEEKTPSSRAPGRQ